MAVVKNTVYYVSVSRSNRTLCRYSAGDLEIENLAVQCLEKVPLYHNWYFETFRRWKFGFFFEDSHVYFTIASKDLPSSAVLELLQKVKDEYIKVSRTGSKGSFSGSPNVQEQLAPVFFHLITSLEQVSSSHEGSIDATHSGKLSTSPSPSVLNGASDHASSSKAPLLGKYDKSDKKSNDHIIELEDRTSTERAMKTADSPALDSNSQALTDSPSSFQKDFGVMRARSNAHLLRRRWCLQVRIILAIDIVVCLILFGVWLWICHGFACIR